MSGGKKRNHCTYIKERGINVKNVYKVLEGIKEPKEDGGDLEKQKVRG